MYDSYSRRVNPTPYPRHTSCTSTLDRDLFTTPKNPPSTDSTVAGAPKSFHTMNPKNSRVVSKAPIFNQRTFICMYVQYICMYVCI